MLFLDIRFDNFEMKQLYKDYRNDHYLKLRENYEPGYTERNNILSVQIHYMNLIEDFIRENTGDNFKTLLDWGGESGINTPFFHPI